MADKLQFDLVSPERLLLSEDVDMVTLPGTEGEFGVLPGHAPVLSTLKPGIVEVQGVSNPATARLFVRGGFAEVNADQVTVLAEEAIPLSELDADQLDQRIKNAEEDLAAAKPEDRDRVAATLDHLKQLRVAIQS